MNKLFVVSDVHSFFSIMMTSLIKKGFDINNNEHKLLLCGDLFDRGDETLQLYEFVKSLGDRFIYVRGNHEDLLKDCVSQIVNSVVPISHYHFSNGTVNTVAQLCNIPIDDFYFVKPCVDLVKVKNIMSEIIDWIDKKAVDYFELKDYIFVHGWLPCKSSYFTSYGTKEKLELLPKENWNDKNIWQNARWINGLEAWRQGCILDGKTIVCGHWHCSWGWSHIKQQRKEFPSKSVKGWEKSFEPFIDKGIMAIDACTAWSGICNVVVIDM